MCPHPTATGKKKLNIKLNLKCQSWCTFDPRLNTKDEHLFYIPSFNQSLLWLRYTRPYDSLSIIYKYYLFDLHSVQIKNSSVPFQHH